MPPAVSAAPAAPAPLPDLSHLEVSQLDLDALRARVAGCTACALHKSRTQTVFGVGNPAAGEEEKALLLLLRAGADVPPAQELPPAEVFFDPDCRNIYLALCDLYRDEDSPAPTGADVVARLGEQGAAIDRAARLLLQDSVSGEGNLRGSLDSLLNRWRKQRKAELKRQIKQAEQQIK